MKKLYLFRGFNRDVEDWTTGFVRTYGLFETEAIATEILTDNPLANWNGFEPSVYERQQYKELMSYGYAPLNYRWFVIIMIDDETFQSKEIFKMVWGETAWCVQTIYHKYADLIELLQSGGIFVPSRTYIEKLTYDDHLTI